MEKRQCNRPEWQTDAEKRAHPCPLEDSDELPDACPKDCEWMAEDPDDDPHRYAISFEDGAFVPCPHCGAEVVCPDRGFDSDAEAMTWALENCTCMGAAS